MYLPGQVETDFHTVSRSLCSSPEALEFLRALGLKEPDLVADVMRNVLPKYQAEVPEVDEAKYEEDIGRIAKAYAEADASARADGEYARLGDSFATKAVRSRKRREELLREVRKSRFVRVVDAGTARSRLSTPDDVHLPTERLKRLFDRVDGVSFVDYRWDCLRGKGVQALLEAFGATHLRAVWFDPKFTWKRLSDLRRGDGSTKLDTVRDWTIRGLDSLLRQMEGLDAEERSEKAALLWEALVDFVEHGGSRFLKGSYEYFYYSKRSSSFNADSVNRLNKTAWIPSEDGGTLRAPKDVEFDYLGWEHNPILCSHISFKPPTAPIVRELAKQVGIEPEKIAVLREFKGTTEELREKLGMAEEPTEGVPVSDGPDSVVGPPYSVPTLGKSARPADPFAKRFHGVQTHSLLSSADNPVVLPPGGPMTRESARQHTAISGHVGRTESRQTRLEKRSALGPQGKALADEFYEMVTGDYGKHCQICGRTFTRTGGGWQVNVFHVVPPVDDHRTNHFGNLLGLCGWHFNLMQNGKRDLLDPETKQPFGDVAGAQGWERMKDAILNQDPETDEFGNSFMSLPIRFYNVYRDWEAEPTTLCERIRYSIPHWTYLCELLKT